MPINKNQLSKEMIEKALQCKTTDELMKLAKDEGFDITKDEAEAYFNEMADKELDAAALHKVAGGFCWEDCVGQYDDSETCRSRCPQW